MRIHWIKDSGYGTLKALEEDLIERCGINPEKSTKWLIMEETALAFGQGKEEGIWFFSLPRGTKINPFSYRKVNQTIYLSYSSESEKLVGETFFFRLSRRFKNEKNRLKLLSVKTQEQLDALIKELVTPSQAQVNLERKIEFTYALEKKSWQEKFITLCQEFQIESLQYTVSFPIRLNEENLEKKFLEEERLVFQGFIQEDKIDFFIGALEEEGFGRRNLILRSAQKISGL